MTDSKGAFAGVTHIMATLTRLVMRALGLLLSASLALLYVCVAVNLLPWVGAVIIDNAGLVSDAETGFTAWMCTYVIPHAFVAMVAAAATCRLVAWTHKHVMGVIDRLVGRMECVICDGKKSQPDDDREDGSR